MVAGRLYELTMSWATCRSKYWEKDDKVDKFLVLQEILGDLFSVFSVSSHDGECFRIPRLGLLLLLVAVAVGARRSRFTEVAAGSGGC